MYFAGNDIERDIWAACGVIPPRGPERLVIVHDAHKLRRPGELVPLVKAGREAAGVFCCSSPLRTDFPRTGGGKGAGPASGGYPRHPARPADPMHRAAR